MLLTLLPLKPSNGCTLTAAAAGAAAWPPHSQVCQQLCNSLQGCLVFLHASIAPTAAASTQHKSATGRLQQCLWVSGETECAAAASRKKYHYPCLGDVTSPITDVQPAASRRKCHYEGGQQNLTCVIQHGQLPRVTVGQITGAALTVLCSGQECVSITGGCMHRIEWSRDNEHARGMPR